MTYVQVRAVVAQQLASMYEPREAENIAGWLMDALFDWRSASSHAPLSQAQQHRLADMMLRLLAGEPVQYATGVCWFYGLKLQIDARALIPRPETEELVRLVLEQCRRQQHLRVLDIGTGSGCIAIALKRQRPDWTLAALDVSASALELAQLNAQAHGCDIRFWQADILDETQWPRAEKWDVVVSNPPYIPQREIALMPEQVWKYEPARALFVPDAQPLLFYENIARFAAGQLEAGGHIFLEVNEFYAERVEELLEASGWQALAIHPDLQGKPRMVSARREG